MSACTLLHPSIGLSSRVRAWHQPEILGEVQLRGLQTKNHVNSTTSSHSMHMCASKKPLFMKVDYFFVVKAVMDYLAGMKHPKAPWLGAAAMQRWPLMVSKQHCPRTTNFCDSFPTVYCTCHEQHALLWQVSQLNYAAVSMHVLLR